MRPCPQFEHHGGQPEGFDRGTCRFALGLQLAEGGAQEDPDALVGSADRRRVSVHSSSVAQARAARHPELRAVAACGVLRAAVSSEEGTPGCRTPGDLSAEVGTDGMPRDFLGSKGSIPPLMQEPPDSGSGGSQ